MSDETRLDYTVPDEAFNEAQQLIDENRTVTANSKTGKAFYGRKLFHLGLEKLQEKQQEKKEKAIDFRETENEIKNLIENKELTDVIQ